VIADAAPLARDLSVELPDDASGMVRVSDAAAGIGFGFALEGAAPVARATSGNLSIYPNAAGGDVLHRIGAHGIEDFIALAAPPAREEIRYRLDVRQIQGLRLVERTLELLDDRGAPRFRVAPPEIVDAGGRRIPASLSLEGCAADESPRAPWGRPVTPPGAPSCVVKVSWAGRGVAYPALVDPAWVSTKSMVTERWGHAVAPLPNPATPPADASPLLLTGGVGKSGAVLSSAEIYEPLSRTFAATGPMNKARAAHSATKIATSSTGLVLVAGGAGVVTDATPPERLDMVALADAASTEIYNPGNGNFVLGPNMNAPRFDHVAITLGDGRVLFAGGITDLVHQPTKQAELFSFDPVMSQGSFALASGSMATARYGHAAALLPSGDVLVTGGIGSAGFATLSGEIFCASASCTVAQKDRFSAATGQMTAARAYHTATALANGDILLAGGVNAVQAPISYWSNAEIYKNGAFQITTISMGGGRAFHTATALTPPLQLPGSTDLAEVLLAGGFDGSADLGSVEAYVPATGAMVTLSSLPLSTTRRRAASALVSAGQSVNAGRAALVTGGISGSATSGGGTFVNGTATKTAELLVKQLGDACAAAGECLSGFCADGVCCDAACNQQCFSCTQAKKEDGSADGTCGPTKAGTILPTQCINELEVHNQCDGAGHTEQASATKDCKPGTCGSDGLCSVGCDDVTTFCSPTGWCDLSAADGGMGQCQKKRPLSAQCGANVQCESGNCVDGLCCDLPCDGQCQACDLPGFPGKCLPVGSDSMPADPHPNADGDKPRAPCAGTVNGMKTGCAGSCVGQAMMCAYPGASASLTEPDCADADGGPSTLTSYPCAGDGSSTTQTADCNGFRCATAHACKTTCATDADCIQDYVCLAGDGGAATCQKLTGPLCDGEHTLRRPVADGGNMECPDHYGCPAGATACLTSCESVNDCVAPYVCNGKHVCTEPLTAPALPGCSAATSADRRAWPLAAIAIGALAIARRRKQRKS
jgi:MYXO-CTERM domain-containing protein